MKNRTLILLFTLCSFAVKADTIDFWHVYYNGRLIKQCNGFGTCELTLKSKRVKSIDSLSFMYCRDTRCSECQTTISIEDKKGISILEGKGIGTCNPIKFSVRDILAHNARGEPFLVFYNGEIHPKYKSQYKQKKIFMVKICFDD